jgi:pimeloyl-ACP methyl ester carboxylesterase
VRTSDGVALAVLDHGGDGPPVLLLHGLMGCARTWAPVAAWLPGRVLALDARGHGASGAHGPWTSERMADDAAELLERVGPAVVVGHSMGGLHGLLLAARHPELVRALVVEDMGVDFTGRDAAAAAAWFGAFPRSWPSLDALRAAFAHPRPEFGDYMAESAVPDGDGWRLAVRVEHAAAIAAEWARVPRWAELAAVRCPVLLVEAEESVAPPGQVAQVARRLRDARHVRIPGTGHLVHRSAPREHRAVVEPFVRAHLDAQTTSTPTTRASTGSTGCSAANAAAGSPVASTQCGSQVPGR